MLSRLLPAASALSVLDIADSTKSVPVLSVPVSPYTMNQLPATEQELFTLRALAEMAQDPNSDAHQVLHHMRSNAEAVQQMQQQLTAMQDQIQAQLQAQSQPNSTGSLVSLSAALEALTANNLEQQQLHQSHQESMALILDRLSQRHATPTRTHVVPPLSTKFKGIAAEMTLSEFQAKLQAAFQRYKSDLFTDPDRIMYAFQSMEGTPSRLLAAYVNREIPDEDGILVSYDAFAQFLEETFGDKHELETNTQKFLRLRQSGGTMIDYITQFRTLSARLTWNESALLAHFKAGLSEEVKSMLAPQWHTFRTLRDIISAATTAYQNLQVQSRFRSRPAFSPARPQQQQAPRRSAVATQPYPTPMDLDTVRFSKLTTAEKQRRRDAGLCMYCADKGHFASACPKKGAQLAVVSVLESENESA